MSKFIDITGQKYGRLTAIRMVGQDKFRASLWLFSCECGNEIVCRAHSVRKGNTKSCGCLHKDIMSAIKTTHGMSNKRIYNIYHGMKARCYNPRNSAYEFYGLKGISVCHEWLNSFQSFYEWAISNGYTDDLTIDRKDSKKGYCPDNCQWISLSEQQSNRSNNLLITIKKETKTQKQWLEQFGVDRNVINYYRFDLGLSPKDAMMKVIERVTTT